MLWAFGFWFGFDSVGLVVGLVMPTGFAAVIVWYFWLDCDLCWIYLLSLLF